MSNKYSFQGFCCQNRVINEWFIAAFNSICILIRIKSKMLVKLNVYVFKRR